MNWSLRGKTLSASLVLLGALLLSACGATTTNPLGGGAPPGATSGSSALLNTRSASVKGTTETVLTTAQGMTLYYFDKDTATSVACTGGGYGGYGGCTKTWPPLVSPTGAAPTSSVSLPGGLSILNGANGQQVMYNGHPLYMYSGDQKPGDTNGDGIMGLWHVATPSLASGSAPAVGPTATPSGGYGGYGGYGG